MKKAHIYASVAVAIACIYGCGTNAPKTSTGNIQFNYKTDNPKLNGIVQVFDIDGNTVIHIKNIDVRMPVFLDKTNNQLKHQIVGETAVFNGIQKSITVVTANGSSQVLRVHSPIAAKELLAAPAVENKFSTQMTAIQAKYKGVSEEELRSELDRMKQELASLKKFIMENDSSTNAVENHTTRKELTYAQITSSKQPTTVRVTFKDNSNKFEPEEQLRSTLIELAKVAEEISIRGYTDGTIMNVQSKTLAKTRALAAKNYLTQNGIKPQKISVAYEPVGNFIADNNTKHGRQSNRRVEIDLL